jgi:hypothetical protein
MNKQHGWRWLAVAVASCAIAALAAGGSSSVKVARLQFDGGVSDVPATEVDAGTVEPPQDSSVDGGAPGELQGSLGGKRSFARTVVE